jgi:predicted amidohydrolase
MKFCVAQTEPVKGDIQQNIVNHQLLINRALTHGTDTIIFPELSLTGYEPALAKTLATTPNDAQFNVFQTISDTHDLTIGVGMPTQNETGLNISMLLFQPYTPRRTYSKKYLHADEEPFFISGPNFSSLPIQKVNTAIAICYELSIPQHAADAHQSGAEIYIASVAKTTAGIKHAHKRLADIARTYTIPVLLSNCVGPSDNFVSAGGTAVWDDKGSLLAKLDDTGTGFLIYDTETQAIIEEQGLYPDQVE